MFGKYLVDMISGILQGFASIGKGFSEISIFPDVNKPSTFNYSQIVSETKRIQKQARKTKS